MIASNVLIMCKPIQRPNLPLCGVRLLLAVMRPDRRSRWLSRTWRLEVRFGLPRRVEVFCPLSWPGARLWCNARSKLMKNLAKQLPAFDEKKKCLNVIVETPKGSRVKYAYEPEC